MEALLDILNELHPEVDFTTHTSLIDDKVLDSFDIVTIVAEVNGEYDVAIPAEELVGVTAVDLSARVHAMMAADLGKDLVLPEENA